MGESGLVGRARTSTFARLAVAIGFAMAMTAPIEVLYARRLGVGGPGLALYVLSSGISVLSVDLFGTRVVPMLEARRALTVGIALFGASSAVLCVAPSFVFLVGGRLMQGFASAVLNGSALQASIRIHATRERAISSVQGSTLLGGALGAPIGGLVASAVAGTAGFRLAFAVCAALSVAIAGAVRLALPLVPPRLASVGRARLSVPRLSVPPLLRLALVLGMLGHYLRGGLENTALPLVGDARGFSTASIGLTLGLLSVVEIATLRSSRVLFSRWPPSRCLLAGLALGVCAACVLAISSSLPGFLVAAAMFGVVDAIAMVAPPLIIMALSADDSTGLASYRIACGFGSMLGATTVTGAVAAAGAFGALSVVGGAMVASITLLGAMHRRRVAVG